ncbi:glycosyltransferase [Halocatena halophila]|uniref:glycosyltransferase n=1 Tax=Halocatena halophila TaxID=2814576 RepID=UPI002ED19549
MMTPQIAVVYYPEGAGHATRMLAVGRALEKRGATVSVAGGGPGTQFVRMNGYDPFIPTTVDFIDTRQLGMGGVLTDSVPRAVQRIRDLVGWLRRVSPAALVTDDMFATIAANVAGVTTYHLSHNSPGLYSQYLERIATSVLSLHHQYSARSFFYPAVWEPCRADPPRCTRVGPIALEGDTETPDIDVLVVPSVYSREMDRFIEPVREDGRSVLAVGGPDWEPVVSLFPYIEAANLVICSGYSTVMEAAVAGTPCVVRPFTDEQRGVAALLAETDGFAVVDSPSAVSRAVARPPPAPSFKNGTDLVAERVLSEIDTTQPSHPRPTATPSSATGSRPTESRRSSGL